MSEEQITPNETQQPPQPRGITRITVQGFKSLRDETSIEIRPLTILAGANSSGKSSIMQPLLLMKQTLEAPYDPGPLKLDGPNVYFTRVEQAFWLFDGQVNKKTFTVGIEIDGSELISSSFAQIGVGDLSVLRTQATTIGRFARSYDIKLNMRPVQVRAMLSLPSRRRAPNHPYRPVKWTVVRERCFLKMDVYTIEDGNVYPHTIITPGEGFAHIFLQLVHVPGIRGNPQRSYPVNSYSRYWSDNAKLMAAPGDEPDGPFMFPGTFEHYSARVVYNLQTTPEGTPIFTELLSALNSLGLTDTIEAVRTSYVEIELRVGRLPHNPKGEKPDTVNIADVGFGVSQVLPVVVALLVAEPGQLVYIEQPELHLHPDAQAKMAELLASAARRGVRVVVETHSDILLLAIQTLVAKYAADKENGLDPSLVKLHWFSRDDEGVTHVQSADLDDAGTFGEWPEDFGQIRFNQLRDFLTYSMESPAEVAQAEKAKANGRSHNRKNGRNGKSETEQAQEAVATNVEAAE